MAGNVSEWTSSQWCPYPASGITPPCGSQPIIYRGGGFNDADATALNGAHRYYDVPPFSPTNVGVRCAKSL
jgi:formylglycine-generating enzyme required for sulfatase activity